MKKRLRGVKRRDIQFDFDLYRTKVPMRDVAGAELSVLDLWPEGAETTIMFVHGYAGVLESWEYQINHFAKTHRVIAPDLRGHGQSDAPFTRYTMDEMVMDLHTIVEHLDVPYQFVLVGHSFGGSICVEYANAHPERLSKLVLIATAGEYPLPRAATWLLNLPLTLFRPFWKYRPRWDAELHVMKRMANNNMRRWKGWPLLRNLSMPTLVITGERDTYFPRRVFDDVGQMIPNADVYDVGTAKHKVQLERHRAVTRAIERFVGDTSSASWRDRISSDSPLQDRIWVKSYSPGTPPTLPIPRRPLTDFLESTAEWLPKRTATVFYGSKLTYEQLNEQVNQFANVLHGLGVRPGDRVMIVLPNMPQMIVAFYATLKIGGIAVLPNPVADAGTMIDHVKETTPRVFVTVRVFNSLAQQIEAETGLDQFIFADFRSVVSTLVYHRLIEFFGITDDESRHKTLAKQLGQRMSTVRQDAPVTPPAVDVKHTDVAAIIYTSGTTQEPKGVCLTHENLVANTVQTRHWIPDLEYGEEVCLAVIPLLHSYGLTSAMNVPIAIGATIALLPVFETEQVLKHIRDLKVTIFPGVPAMYMAINQAPDVRRYGLSSIKACVSGASPLPIEVQEAFEKLTRGRLVEGYGLTEASPVTHANPLYGVRKTGSIGVPLPNTDAKIIDLVTGEDLPVGHVGELAVRGPQVMKGYWLGEGEFDDDIISDGWLETGDVAVMDSDRYFQIINRKQDTIVFGEYNVYPRDVEEVIYENPKVMEAAVVGVGRVDGEKKVKAFVVPRPNANLTKEELLDLCRRRLEPYEVPWDIEFRSELPKSFIGKILRRLLVQGESDSIGLPR